MSQLPFVRRHVMAVSFRFDTVLKVREAERDKCRLALVQEQQREAGLLAELNKASSQRDAVQTELRELQKRGTWSAEQALACHQRAEHLGAEMSQIQIALLEVNVALQRCHRELLEAD